MTSKRLVEISKSERLVDKMFDTRHSVQNLVDHRIQDTHTKNKKNMSDKINFLESADRNH